MSSNVGLRAVSHVNVQPLGHLQRCIAKTCIACRITPFNQTQALLPEAMVTHFENSSSSGQGYPLLLLLLYYLS